VFFQTFRHRLSQSIETLKGGTETSSSLVGRGLTRLGGDSSLGSTYTGLVLALARPSDVLITERRCLALGLLAPAPNPIRRVRDILTFPTEDKRLCNGPRGHAFTGTNQDGIEVHTSLLRLLTPALCPISGSGKGWLPGPACRHRGPYCTP